MAVVKRMEACGSSSGSVNQRVSIAECGEVSTPPLCRPPWTQMQCKVFTIVIGLISDWQMGGSLFLVVHIRRQFRSF